MTLGGQHSVIESDEKNTSDSYKWECLLNSIEITWNYLSFLKDQREVVNLQIDLPQAYGGIICLAASVRPSTITHIVYHLTKNLQIIYNADETNQAIVSTVGSTQKKVTVERMVYTPIIQLIWNFLSIHRSCKESLIKSLKKVCKLFKFFPCCRAF